MKNEKSWKETLVLLSWPDHGVLLSVRQCELVLAVN